MRIGPLGSMLGQQGVGQFGRIRRYGFVGGNVSLGSEV